MRGGESAAADLCPFGTKRRQLRCEGPGALTPEFVGINGLLADAASSPFLQKGYGEMNPDRKSENPSADTRKSQINQYLSHTFSLILKWSRPPLPTTDRRIGTSRKSLFLKSLGKLKARSKPPYLPLNSNSILGEARMETFKCAKHMAVRIHGVGCHGCSAEGPLTNPLLTNPSPLRN